jgi:hypothetical protein
MPVSKGAIVDARKQIQNREQDIIRTKQDWNDYVDWAEQKGLRYSPTLNPGEGKENTGNKLLQRYIDEHPETSLKVEKVGEYQTMLQDIFKSLQEDQELFQEDEAFTFPKDFVKISKKDEKAGPLTLRKFPTSSYQDIKTGQIFQGGFSTPTDRYPKLPIKLKQEIAQFRRKAIERAIKRDPKILEKIKNNPRILEANPSLLELIKGSPKLRVTPTRTEIKDQQQALLKGASGPVIGPGGTKIGELTNGVFNLNYDKNRINSEDVKLISDAGELNKYLQLKGATQEFTTPF